MSFRKVVAIGTVLAVLVLCGCSGVLKDEAPSETTDVIEVVE